MSIRCMLLLVLFLGIVLAGSVCHAVTTDEVIIGLNIPLSGPYVLQGQDQRLAYALARQEINGAGGILGRKIRYIIADSKTNADVSVKNVEQFIEQDVDMVTGGSSSSVAIAVSRLCQKHKKLFLAVLTSSNDTTGKDAHRHTFRETYNAWMGAKALSRYLNRHFTGKKYFYITSDYTWGWTTRDSLKKFTHTEDAPDILMPLGQKLGSDVVKSAVAKANAADPDVLVLILFGRDMVATVKECNNIGLSKRAQIVVPALEIHMTVGGPPRPTEGVVGCVPWYWEIPFKYNYTKGKEFAEKFRARYGKPPGSGAATAYTNIMLYKWAVEKTGSFKSADLIRALEGHEFELLKDKEVLRAWDHQGVQTVFVVKGRGANMKEDWDVFEVLEAYPGDELVQTPEENPVQLEPLYD